MQTQSWMPHNQLAQRPVMGPTQDVCTSGGRARKQSDGNEESSDGADSQEDQTSEEGGPSEQNRPSKRVVKVGKRNKKRREVVVEEATPELSAQIEAEPEEVCLICRRTDRVNLSQTRILLPHCYGDFALPAALWFSRRENSHSACIL